MDSSFNPGPVTAQWAIVHSIIVQPDGKLLIGGTVDYYDGVERYAIVRANPNGSLDDSFNPGAGPNNPIYALALSRRGIVAGGTFQSFSGENRYRIARLNHSGPVDASFDPGRGVVPTLDDVHRNSTLPTLPIYLVKHLVIERVKGERDQQRARRAPVAAPARVLQ